MILPFLQCINYALKNIMKQLSKITGIWFAAYFIATLISGCTAIGYGIGSAIDSGNKQKHSLRAGDDLSKYEGNDAIFYEKNGLKYEGTYRRPEFETRAVYRSIYETRRRTEPEEILFPLGSDLILQTVKSGDRTIKFNGFVREGIVDEKDDVIRYDDISWINDPQNGRIKSSIVKRNSAIGELPLRDVFYCDNNKIAKIYANDISDIVVASSTHWAAGLAITGLVIDIVFFALARSFNDSWGGSYGGWGSSGK